MGALVAPRFDRLPVLPPAPGRPRPSRSVCMTLEDMRLEAGFLAKSAMAVGARERPFTRVNQSVASEMGAVLESASTFCA